MALLVLPVLTATFDYVENDGIRAMLAAGPRVEADLVDWASFWTQAKSIAGLLSEATSVVLSVIVFHRWWQRRRAGP